MSAPIPLGLEPDSNPFWLLAVAHDRLQESDQSDTAARCAVPNITRNDAGLAEDAAESILHDSTEGLLALAHLIVNHDGHSLGGTAQTLEQVGRLVGLLAHVQQYALGERNEATTRLWAHDRIAARTEGTTKPKSVRATAKEAA